MGPPRFGKDYKCYISGIFPANWGMDYATDPTFYENQKQPLTIWDVSKTRLQICPLYIFGNYPPQMVPMDLNIGFQGLALIQGQINNPEEQGSLNGTHFGGDQTMQNSDNFDGFPL